MRMRKERRRVVVMGGATAALSGYGSMLHQRAPRWDIAWMVVEAAMVTMTIVFLVFWRRKNPSCER